MLNGLEGVMGSGKSYEAVVFHILEALQKRRKVITNLPLDLERLRLIDPSYPELIEIRIRPAKVLGSWDASRVDSNGKGNAFLVLPTFVSAKPPPKHAFGGVWDFYHPKSDKEIGPLYVIDECHVMYPRIGTDPEVVEWFKLHRHFNADVLLITQKFRGVCPDVSEVIALLIKVRKADVLGKSNSYIRNVHAGYRGGLVSSSVRDYEKKYFGLYISHTQGSSMAESLATDLSPLLVKVKKWSKLIWVFFFLGVAFMVFRGKNPFSVQAPQPVKSVTTASISSPVATASTAVSNVLPGVAPSAKVDTPVEDIDPLAAYVLHLRGSASMGDRVIYSFAVSAGGRGLFDLSLSELKQTGYTFKPLGSCVGIVTFKGLSRPVVCDAPAVESGQPSRPVVMDLGGRKSDS